MYPVHYVPAGDVLPIFFDTYAGATGASVTMTGLAVTDIEIYKDGSTTQRSSDAGYTLLDTDGIDFDGITGIHGFSIDTSNNTDSGFYTVGAWFHVVVSAVTVDSQTVNFIAAAFRLMPAESSAAVPKVDVSHYGGTAGTFASGRPEVNATHAAGTAWASGAITAASIAADAITAAKVAADVTTEIQSGLATAAELAKVPKSDSNVTWNATALASINTQCDTALTDYDAPTNAEMVARTLVAADYATATALATVDTVVDAILVDTAEIGAAGAGLTALASQSSVNTIDDLLDTEIPALTSELAKVPKSDGTATWNATALASIQSEANDALVAYDPPTAAELTAAVANVSVDEIQPSALADLFNTDSGTTYASAVAGSVVAEIADNAGGSGLTVGAIADAVWDEALAGHVGSGSTGEALSAAGGAGDPWITTLPGAYSSGQAGYILGTNLNATVSSRATQTSVDDLPTNAELATALDPLPTAAENATAVWGAGTRSLTILDEDSTTLDLDATIRSAVGLASANLDTQLGDLPTAAEAATAVWAAGTRVLTAGTNIALAKGTGVTGFNDLSAAQVNAEVDTALADYDAPTRAELTSDTNSVLTAVGDVPTNAELATALGTADDAVLAAIAALNNISVASILGATVEGSTTLVQSLRLLNAALGGKASGLATSTAVYRDVGDSKNRISATVDADGNRSAVTLDLT